MLCFFSNQLVISILVQLLCNPKYLLATAIINPGVQVPLVNSHCCRDLSKQICDDVTDVNPR